MTFKDFTADEQETLELLLMESDQWRVICKAIQVCVDQHRDEVTGVAVNESSDAFKIAMLKKKYEGALQVQIFMEGLKRKKEKKNANR